MVLRRPGRLVLAHNGSGAIVQECSDGDSPNPSSSACISGIMYEIVVTCMCRKVVPTVIIASRVVIVVVLLVVVVLEESLAFSGVQVLDLVVKQRDLFVMHRTEFVNQGLELAFDLHGSCQVVRPRRIQRSSSGTAAQEDR